MGKKIILSTKRLKLRPFEEKDYNDFCEYISDFRVNQNLGILSPTNPNTLTKLFETNLKNPLCWALEPNNSNKIIGDIHFDNIVENYLGHLGFALNFNYQNNGYAFEAAQKIIDFGFDIVNLQRIRAVSLTCNTPSIKLLKKLDFQEEALIYEYDFGGTIGDVFFFSKVNNFKL